MDYAVAIVLGLLAGVFGFVSMRAGEWHLARGYKWSKWSDDLKHDALDLIHAELLVAECRARLGARIGKMPEDFDRVAFAALGLGAAIERTVYAEAERRGIAGKGLVPTKEAAPPSLPAPESAPTPVPASATFVAGHLVRH